MESNRPWIYDSRAFHYFTIFLFIVGIIISFKFMAEAVNVYFFEENNCLSLSGKTANECIELTRINSLSLMVHVLFGLTISMCGNSLLGLQVGEANFFKGIKDGGASDFDNYRVAIFTTFVLLVTGLLFLFSGYGGDLFRWYTLDLIVITVVIFTAQVLIIFYHKNLAESQKEETKE